MPYSYICGQGYDTHISVSPLPYDIQDEQLSCDNLSTAHLSLSDRQELLSINL